MFVRTSSKQKSPKKEELDIVELLRGRDPKEYEKILQEHNIQDYRSILQAMEVLRKEKEAETGQTVRANVAECLLPAALLRPFNASHSGGKLSLCVLQEVHQVEQVEEVDMARFIRQLESHISTQVNLEDKGLNGSQLDHFKHLQS